MTTPPQIRGLNLRQILIIEGRGVRTALATVAPFVAGQLLGAHFMPIGLMIGLGGLYLCISDKNGAGWRTLLATTFGMSIAAFFGTLVGPHLILAPLAMFVWAFVSALTGIWGEAAGNAGFAVTLVFAVTLGISPLSHVNDVSPASLRAIEFAVGGLWAILVTLGYWLLTRQPFSPVDAEPLDLRRCIGAVRTLRTAALTARSPVLLHAFRIAFTAALAVVIYEAFRPKLEHGYWLIITVLVIVKQDWAATRQRAVERMVGSVVGGVLGVLLAATVHNLATIDLLLLLLCMIAFSHSPTNYGLYVVFLTPFVVLMINIAAPGNWKVGLTRIEDNLLGGLLALIVAFVFRAREKAPASPAPSSAV